MSGIDRTGQPITVDFAPDWVLELGLGVTPDANARVSPSRGTAWEPLPVPCPFPLEAQADSTSMSRRLA